LFLPDIADFAIGTGTRLQAAIKDIFDRSLAIISQDIVKAVPTPQAAVTQVSQINTPQRTHNLALGGTFEPANEAFVPSTGSHGSSVLAFYEHPNHSQPKLQDEAQFVYPGSFGNGPRIFSEPNIANHMSSAEMALSLGAPMATISPQIQPNLHHQQLPNRHPSLQHLHHHSQQQFQHSPHPSPTAVDFTNPFTPLPPNFALGPPFQPQMHDISPHQPAVQAMFPQINSAAWRQFADTIMHNIGHEQAYLHNMPSLSHMGGAGGGPMSNNNLDLATAHIASLSGMHLPLQDGGADQPWPLIHNVNNPH
jgi:hypothetical protein